ncbi:MAG: HDOD domain-containing protein [Nitrosomonadales bacterium]|nr:HDOD domain-containing protein [Nitrosomonadales bacterium]
MHADIEKAIKELVSKGIKLPPQPKVLIELQKKLASRGCNTKDLARIISSDPGITAMLFKTVRSPVFSGGRKINSVEQALMVIGVKQVYNLVQAVVLSTSISGATRKSFDIFWTRSQEVAEIAALIAADRVSVCNIFPDQAYLAGIFHECGVPVLMQRFPDYCAKLKLDNTTCWPKLADEDALFNVDHCSIGYLMAHHWKLPDFICHAILYHHEMPHEETGAVRTLVATLQLATHFYHRIARVKDPAWPKLCKEVLAELGIHPDTEQEFYEDISAKFLA